MWKDTIIAYSWHWPGGNGKTHKKLILQAISSPGQTSKGRLECETGGLITMARHSVHLTTQVRQLLYKPIQYLCHLTHWHTLTAMKHQLMKIKTVHWVNNRYTSIVTDMRELFWNLFSNFIYFEHTKSNMPLD